MQDFKLVGAGKSDGDGEFNEEGIKFYDNLINELARHIEPMICLYHFDMRFISLKIQWLLDRHVVDAFVRFGKDG